MTDSPWYPTKYPSLERQEGPPKCSVQWQDANMKVVGKNGSIHPFDPDISELDTETVHDLKA